MGSFTNKYNSSLLFQDNNLVNIGTNLRLHSPVFTDSPLSCDSAPFVAFRLLIPAEMVGVCQGEKHGFLSLISNMATEDLCLFIELLRQLLSNGAVRCFPVEWFTPQPQIRLFTE